MKKIFSDYGDKVDSIVQKHMNIIVEETKKIVPDVVSILAVGGLGRGEGSFLLEKNGIMPLNDYDVYIITKKKIPFDLLKKVSENSSKRIYQKYNFSFEKSSSLMEFYTDLRNMTLRELSKVEPMIKYYEIRESAKIIYGKDVRKQMPNFSLEDIPLSDGLRFLMNRMSLLIESFNENPNSFDIKKTMLYYIGKNYLSCAEALLLLNKKFECSYKKRASILKQCFKEDFPELSKKVPKLVAKVNQYTNNKLRPSKKFFNKDPLKEWLEAKEIMYEVAQFYIHHAFGINVNKDILSENIQKLKNIFMKEYMEIYIKSKYRIKAPKIMLSFLSRLGKMYMNFLYFKRENLLNKKYNFKILFSLGDINLRIYSICSLVLFSLDSNMKIDAEIFNKAIKEIKKIKKIKKIKAFKELSKEYSDLFRIYQFLKS